MPKLIDETGKRYGKVTVLHSERNDKGALVWRCRCDCGDEFLEVGSVLRNHRRSCRSCWSAKTRHGYARRVSAGVSREWRAWRAMKQRCYQPKQIEYHRYGGRGIRVCERWLESFENFLADVGPAPSPTHQIDRFPRADGDYEPNNVRWATHKQQQRNRSTNRLLTHNGKTQCISEWAEELGIKQTIINTRLWRGKSVAESLSPVASRAK